MLPTIAEVVEIVHRLDVEILEHVDEARLARIERPIAEVRIGNAPADVLGAQFIEVTVGPAEGSLQNLVQAVEADRQWYFDPAQDLWLDVVERDLETCDAIGGHAASLRRAASDAQFQGKSSSRRLAGWPAMRASTSASQAWGSTSLSLAVTIRP